MSQEATKPRIIRTLFFLGTLPFALLTIGRTIAQAMDDNPPWGAMAANLAILLAITAGSWWIVVRRLERVTAAKLKSMGSPTGTQHVTQQQMAEREALRVAGDWTRRVEMPVLTVLAVPIVLIGLVGGILTGSTAAVFAALMVLGFGSIVWFALWTAKQLEPREQPPDQAP